MDPARHPDQILGRDRSSATQLIETLRSWADRVRAEELARAERRFRGLTHTEREIVDTVTRDLVAALLCGPARHLRSVADTERAKYADEIDRLVSPHPRRTRER